MKILDYDIWQETLSTIRKHKLRTVLTALGVWWGIFMLIFLMGAGTGLQNGVFGLFGGQATNALYMWTNRTTMPYKGMVPGRRPQLTMDDMTAIRREFGHRIEYMAPRLWVPSGEVVHKDRKGSFELRGDMPELLMIDAIEVVEGRFLNQADLQGSRKVVVIGDRVREVLFEDEPPVGQYLTIRGTEFLVVGTTASDRRDEDDASEDDQTMYIPLSTAQQMTNRPGHVGWFVCTIDPSMRVAEMEEPIAELIRDRHRIHPDDPQGVGSNNFQEEYEQLTGLFLGIRLLVWLVGIGSLLAGIIGVGNIMLIVVRERTREIGIRKALGATPGSIITLILFESVLITTIAGYLGLICSVGVVWLMKWISGPGMGFFANPQIDLGVAAGAIAILVVSGALAGLFPALQAARINPVVALRDE